ncbi:hypothetical protein [Geomonas agri]|uniref:hypothetical protein n=1 Tax=Geomonas agri TaxID=2873702 RepID=UPI001CD3C1B5|nr:hypothetical protein [Geomonas agri]
MISHKTCRAILFMAIYGLLLTACSAHNPFIITNTTQSIPASESKYPAHHDKVFVTEQGLPLSVSFEAISSVEVGKVWYGSSDSVLTSIADRARELGANVVIQVKTWHQPSGWSWAAPHGSGQAVRIDPQSLSTLNVTGSWY